MSLIYEKKTTHKTEIYQITLVDRQQSCELLNLRTA